MAGKIRAAAGDTNTVAALGETADNLAADETGAANYRDELVCV